MITILLTGKNGQVGWELQRSLLPLGTIVALDRRGLDLADPKAIRDTVRAVRPHVIVNAAAYTQVDRAESEPDLAMAINGTAPEVLAEEAAALGALLIHYSTDYVFNGAKPGPYTEEDTPNPLNAYGESKLAGEEAIRASGVPHLILRTSWVYGARGNNFLRTILRLAREREELRVVDDQVGAPTWCRLVAEATGEILTQLCAPGIFRPSPFADVSGLYHVAPAGKTTWCGFARAIVESAGELLPRTPQVTPIASAEHPSPAVRPSNSLLSTEKLEQTFGLRMPAWDALVGLCMEELRQR